MMSLQNDGFDAVMPELIKWYHIRDLFCGTGVNQNVDEAVRLARECQYEDAKWLVSIADKYRGIIDGIDGSVDIVNALLMEVSRVNDKRAMYFVFMFTSSYPMLVLSTNLEYAPAQAQYGMTFSNRHEGTPYLAKAAAQFDREGMHMLAVHTDDPAMVKILYKRAAQLGHPNACLKYGQYGFDAQSPERYVWWKRAISLSHHKDTVRWVVYEFRTECERHIQVFRRSLLNFPGNGLAVYELGHAISGNIKGNELFGVAITTRNIFRQ